MSFTYTSPINSFVQFPCQDTPLSCAPDYPVCLPLMLETDVRFEVFVTSDEYFSLYARVVSDCNTELAPPDPVKVIQQFNSVQVPKRLERENSWIMTLNFLFQSDIDAIECGKCCYIQLWKRKFTEPDPEAPFTDSLLACSCCFIKVCDPCWTSVISYRCNEDAFGFEYFQQAGGGGPNLLANYYNVIRLPMYLLQPQNPSKDKAFVKSDGSRKTLSSRIEKEYQAKTDWLPDSWREKLVMAMKHDIVKIENINSGIVPAKQFTCEGQISWKYEEKLDFPLGWSLFKVNLTPYNRFNSNCK